MLFKVLTFYNFGENYIFRNEMVCFEYNLVNVNKTMRDLSAN